ncbi:MAG: extensin family protein, partial [Pseudomonadota bacterium]
MCRRRRTAFAALILAAVSGVSAAAEAAPLPVPRPGASAVRPPVASLPPPRRFEPIRPTGTSLDRPQVAVPRPRGEAARGLCADHRLEGEVIPPIEGPGRCGVPLPVRVDAVLGVKLSEPLVVNCRTARAFAAWMERGPIRAAPREMGAALTEVTISGTYSCRTRNFVVGGRL